MGLKSANGEVEEAREGSTESLVGMSGRFYREEPHRNPVPEREDHRDLGQESTERVGRLTAAQGCWSLRSEGW